MLCWIAAMHTKHQQMGDNGLLFLLQVKRGNRKRKCWGNTDSAHDFNNIYSPINLLLIITLPWFHCFAYQDVQAMVLHCKSSTLLPCYSLELETVICAYLQSCIPSKVHLIQLRLLDVFAGKTVIQFL